MMLIEKINRDLKIAMKAKDQATLRGVIAIKAALLLMQTEANAKEVDKKTEISLLQKLIKQRAESLEIYEKQGRSDLALIEQEEIAVIQRYLPAQLSEEA